jgi:hypothetical protein
LNIPFFWQLEIESPSVTIADHLWWTQGEPIFFYKKNPLKLNTIKANEKLEIQVEGKAELVCLTDNP